MCRLHNQIPNYSQYLSLEYEKVQNYVIFCNCTSICLRWITVYQKFICKITHLVTDIHFCISNLGLMELGQLAILQFSKLELQFFMWESLSNI